TKGRVIFLNCTQLDAPSIFAASYKSALMLDKMPVASNIIEGTESHALTKKPIPLDIHVELIPKKSIILPPSATIMLLMGPPLLNMNLNAKRVMNPGIA